MNKKAHDSEYEEVRIKSVTPETEGWAITREDGWSFYIPKNKNGVVPHMGDTARFYGTGIGGRVRGLDINGQTVFYRTKAQAAYHDRRNWQKRDNEKKRHAIKNRTKTEAEIAALPPIFQKRIISFREYNPDFIWKYESYELFACQEAVTIATALKTPSRVAEFNNLKWEDQKKLVPTLSDGHSGNTFGVACRLAFLYLTNPELICQEHGALCPLVGCNAYGCWAARQTGAGVHS